MTDLVMLSHIQILQDCSRGNDTILQMFHTESLQILRFEVLQQLFASGSFRKDPVVQFKGKELTSEVAFEHASFAPFEQDFFRTEIVEQFVDVVKRTFCCHEFAGGYVEESHTTGCLPEVNSCQEVIFFIRQDIVIDCNTGSYQFRDTPLHQFLGCLRVFQLVTDGYASSGTDQFRQISIQGMVRKSCHFYRLSLSVRTFGERNTQYFCCGNGILRISFVKVSTPEQHDCIRVFSLQIEILFHHRSQYYIIILCHGSVLSLLEFNTYFQGCKDIKR